MGIQRSTTEYNRIEIGSSEIVRQSTIMRIESVVVDQNSGSRQLKELGCAKKI
jgi:hypothetical protein